MKLGKDLLWLRHYHYDVFEPFDKEPKDGIDTTDKSPTHFQFQMNEAGEINAVSVPLEPTIAPLKFSKTPKPKTLSKDSLIKFTGDYELGTVVVKVYVKDEKTLFVLVPGQPDYELVPVDTNKFMLKILSGYYVQFDVNDHGITTGLSFLQPNGNFKAKKK